MASSWSGPGRWGFLPDEGIIFTQLDKAINWARKNSIWPMSFGLACCAIEMMSMIGVALRHFAVRRRGDARSPRQSDLMIIAGRVSNKMAPVIRRLYEQMPEPKWVISMGACATSTGVFSNYALVPRESGDPGGRVRARMPSPAGAADLRHHAPAEEDSERARKFQARAEYRLRILESFLRPVVSKCVDSTRTRPARRERSRRRLMVLVRYSLR